MLAEKNFQVGVKAIIKNSRGEILLLRANSKNFQKRGRTYWDLPGGRIRGKGIEETLKDEILEETGIKKIKILGIFDAAISNIKHPEKNVGWILIAYRCIAGKEKIKLSNEHTDRKSVV